MSMNHAIATAILGSSSASLTNTEAIHEAWKCHVSSNTHRRKVLDDARDVLIKNVETVLENLWTTSSSEPPQKRKLCKDMRRMRPRAMPKAWLSE